MRLHAVPFFFFFLVFGVGTAWGQSPLPPGCSPNNVRAHFEITEQSAPGAEDRVGSDDNFGPGSGATNANGADFKVSVWVDTTVTVLFMRVFNDADGQVWSTRREPDTTPMSRAQNPLLLIGPSGTVNSSYVDRFTLEGGVTYTAYAQPELSSVLAGHSSFDMYLVGCTGSAGENPIVAPGAVELKPQSPIVSETDAEIKSGENLGIQTGSGLIASYKPFVSDQRLPLSSLIRRGKIVKAKNTQFPAPVKAKGRAPSSTPEIVVATTVEAKAGISKPLLVVTKKESSKPVV
jgi:hypothetical protein